MARTEILIADDHAIVRQGLRLLLEAAPDMRVVGEAADGDEAVRLAGSLRPRIVLLDVNMPGLGGAPAIARVTSACPTTAVIVLSMHEDVGYVRAAFGAGASAYVAKRSSAETLLRAVRDVVAGERFVDPLLPQQAVAKGAEALSHREQEVAQRVAQGFTNREIAAALGISKSSVETYRARAFVKLGVDGRAELIARLERQLSVTDTEVPTAGSAGGYDGSTERR